MSTAPIARSALTTEVVAYMATALAGENILVGRGLAPPAGGWVNGQPGTSEFVNYVTIKTGNATSPVPGNPPELGRARTSWEVSYSLTSVGALESHADDVGDSVRSAIVGLPDSFTLRGFTWSLQKVNTPRLGATVRNDSTDPAFWEVTDDVSLWLSLNRAQ
jgi:hypothetical protein